MVAFDIGTTFSKVACVDAAGKPFIVSNPRGEPQTPSVVFFGDDGEVLVGTDACEQGFLDPERCFRNFKLKLGSVESLTQNGSPVTATDATTELIRQLKASAERQLGFEIKEAVATCPANFRDDSKQALMEAFERNGVKILKIVPEPTAAGLAYACEQVSGGLTFAIYDFGGGTFDVSIVRADGSEIRVLSTAGRAQLGGNDINACIERRVLEAFKAKFGKLPTAQSDPLFFQELAPRIENAKIALNSRGEVPIVMGYKGDQLVVTIKQAEFHADIAPLISESLAALDEAISAAGLKPDQIDRLIMVGGTSNLRYIQDAVANHTGLVPRFDIDPIKAVAYGGACAAVIEMKNKGRRFGPNSQVLPPIDSFVRDVTAHAVGCCVADGKGSARRLLQAVIIPKNTPIPCRKMDRFYLEHDDQTEARIEILQGEAGANRDDCLLIGEINLQNLPKEPKRTDRIQVEYIVDSNGMITATATDAVSGQQQTVSVDYKKGIKPKPQPASI